MNARQPLAGKKFLVVDDENFSRSIIYNFCLSLGAAEAKRACNGAEGIEILLADPSIDLVICDVNMPVLNGLEMLQAIRTGFNGINHSLPVIMLTGNADAALVGGALALDCDSFLVKPVSKLALAERILLALKAERPARTPDQYAAVDVKAILDAIRKMAAKKPTQMIAPTVIPDGARIVSIDEVVPPAVLALEMRLPTGEELVPVGATVTARLIDRLRELVPLGIPCDTMVIYDPEP